MTHSDTSGAVVSYVAGVTGITLSGLTINDWILILSLMVLLIRVPMDAMRFYKTMIKPHLKSKPEN